MAYHGSNDSARTRETIGAFLVGLLVGAMAGAMGVVIVTMK